MKRLIGIGEYCSVLLLPYGQSVRDFKLHARIDNRVFLMPADSVERNLTECSTFRHWTTVTLRYSDQDPMGHINNCAFSEFIEASRTSYINGLVDQVNITGLEFVLASITIDFIRELLHPGNVEVGARVIRVGNKSFETGYGIFSKGRSVATARCVSVFFDMNTRLGIAPPDRVRQLLETELATP